MKSSTYFIVVVIFLGALNAKARNNSFVEDFRKNSQAREQKRWTLQEWLDQQDRNRMMDLWLAMNSSSPYESLLGFQSSTYKKSSSSSSSEQNNLTSGFIEFHAYAQMIGLTAEYENNITDGYNDVSGLFNIRIFGNSIHNSNLTLSYGLRTRTLSINNQDFRIAQQFPQIKMTIHLMKHFGIFGLYRSYMEASDTSLGKINGQLTRAGIFIDFEALRLLGTWFEDKFENLPTTQTTASSTTRSGLGAGFQICF